MGTAGAQRPKGTRRGGFQPPEKPSPHRGEGVAAYAATDEGSSYPCLRLSHRICRGDSALRGGLLCPRRQSRQSAAGGVCPV